MARDTGDRGSARVRAAKGRTPSSTRWLQRQLNDPYVAEAKKQGYRSRAAFKLAGLDDRHRFLKRGALVLDLGAAPGGWTQLAVRRGARVVALDVAEIAPIEGAEVRVLDVFAPDAVARIKALLGAPANVVLSDMAPAASGHRATDHLRIMALAEAALEVARAVLAPEGAFVVKLWQGADERAFFAALKRDFATVAREKPAASRADSAETYILASGFRGKSPHPDPLPLSREREQ
jgi:23S rRNA (uridine2552-2'-O)-methyltransferase